jgi:hypothetical protein
LRQINISIKTPASLFPLSHAHTDVAVTEARLSLGQSLIGGTATHVAGVGFLLTAAETAGRF